MNSFIPAPLLYSIFSSIKALHVQLSKVTDFFAHDLCTHKTVRCNQQSMLDSSLLNLFVKGG